jgi:hypothetical protein
MLPPKRLFPWSSYNAKCPYNASLRHSSTAQIPCDGTPVLDGLLPRLDPYTHITLRRFRYKEAHLRLPGYPRDFGGAGDGEEGH